MTSTWRMALKGYIIGVLLGPILLVVFFVYFILFNDWDSEVNRGYTFGYYGEFNTVSNALAKLPGVTIKRSYHNLEITLEEFGFIIQTGSGHEIRLDIGERDPIRDMGGEKLKKELTRRINMESSND